MAQEFDPYYTWLGIPPSERPADHYRLLGVPRFEDNPDVISNAADARMAFLRTFQSGPKGTYTQQILNELAAARTTLLNVERKAAYDKELKAATAAKASSSAVLPVAAAVPAPDQQAIMDDLARQLESVKAREALLAKQQAEYAAALEAEARRKKQEQAKPAIPAAKAIVAEPLPIIVTTPIIAARKPVRKQSISLPLLIAGIAIPVVLLGLVVGYLVTRGKGEPVVIKPSPPDPPTPNVPTPDPKPEKPETDPPGKNPEKPETPVNEKPEVVPVASQTKQVDLLSLVERPRDVPLGEVVRANGKLSIRRRGGFTCAVVPYDLPATYELEMRVTPRDGEGLLIGLPIGRRRCMLTVDGFLNEPPNKQTRTALETIDGRRPQDPAYSGEPYFGKLLKPDQESHLTIQVSDNSVKLTCDGKEVINWTGDPARLGIYGLFNQGSAKRMFVGSWAAQYDISELTLRFKDVPASTPRSKSGLDLLAQIQLPRDLVQGKASQKNDVVSLRSPDGGGFSCVKLPVKAPDNYQLDLRVTSRDAEDGFMVGLSVGGRPCLLGIDGYRFNGTPRTGLETIDGKRPYEAGFSGPVHQGQLLQNGVESSLSIRVIGGTVTLKRDGQEILRWSGDPSQLSIASIFGQHKDRSLFVASWSAAYDVNNLTLQPLSGPAIVVSNNKPNTPKVSPSPATPAADDRPWRWARFTNGGALALTPDKKRAVAFQSGRTPWTVQPIDVATGESGKRVDGPGTIEGPQSFAAGPEPASLVAFSSFENGGITTLVKSLPGERKRERQYTKQPSDMRYAFSAEEKYLAASIGPRVTLINADSGRNLANIEPPPDLRLGFVERMLDDNGLLLVLYTVKRNVGMADHRAVAYDWKSRKVKRTRDFTSRNANLRGLRFQDDDLWVWGNDMLRGMVMKYPGVGASEQPLRLSPSQSVTDIDIPTQTALVVDANVPRLTVRNFATGGKQTQVEYSSPIPDARFVEDGKSVLCQPASGDLTLLWEVAPLLDTRRVVAPTIKEVGLDDAEKQAAAKAVQRSEVKLNSTPSSSISSTEPPDRQEAKAELAKLRVPLPGGTVQFLNIQSSQFTEEHARLLLAFPELDGLHLENVQASEKMLEHLSQLPALRNLTFVRSNLSDEDLAGLAKAPQLQSLNLFETQVQGEGLTHLVDLPLRNFSMAPTPPNLAGWQAIGQLKQLENCGNLGDEADEKLAAISDLPNLKYLGLGNVRLSGEGIKSVAKLTSLANLDLPQNGLADDDLRPLQALTNLQMLSLPNSTGDRAIDFLPAAPLNRLRLGSGTTDAGLLAVAKKYPNLHTCDLTHCDRVTDKGVQHLANNARVQTLIPPIGANVAMYEQVARMSGLKKLEQPFQSAITAAHLKPLRIHPTLEDLQLSKADDESLAELAQFPALKALHLNVPHCKAKGLQALAKASKLERLTMLNGGVLGEYGSEEGTALEKLTQLKQLNIFGTSLDQAAVEKIRQALPKSNVQISR